MHLSGAGHLDCPNKCNDTGVKGKISICEAHLVPMLVLIYVIQVLCLQWQTFLSRKQVQQIVSQTYLSPYIIIFPQKKFIVSVFHANICFTSDLKILLHHDAAYDPALLQSKFQFPKPILQYICDKKIHFQMQLQKSLF